MDTEQKTVKKKYFMDDPREAKRLDTKVNPDEFINDYLINHIHNKEGFNLLDVGCGAGMISSTIARRFFNIKVKGVDLSNQRLSEARNKTQGLGNIKFKQGNIYDLPIKSSSMDLVYTRFLLEYLSNPIKAIKELKRVCKPGGTVILQDLDGQLVSHYPYTLNDLQEVLDGLAESGFDPYIGRKLYHFGKRAGLQPIATDIRPYHKIIGKVDEENFNLWKLKMDIALPKFAAILGEERAISFKNNFMDFLNDEDTMMYSNLFTVYLKKKHKG